MKLNIVSVAGLKKIPRPGKPGREFSVRWRAKETDYWKI
jgi:hypothetical protein